jgi:hypothetical protein
MISLIGDLAKALKSFGTFLQTRRKTNCRAGLPLDQAPTTSPVRWK